MVKAIALDDSRLLDTWDRAAPLARPWRELMLLESASGISVDELALLTIGDRDRLLLALRIGTFGDRLECETRCPSCDARLELSFNASDLMTARSVEPSDFEMTIGDSVLRARLPNSNDVAAALGGEDLVGRLVEVAADAGNRLVREKVSERVAELDPGADISLGLSCAACGHRWQSTFDPAAFLFREVEAYAGRLMNEVHLLARSYAWSEESILAMGAKRRRRYLDLVMQ